MISSLTAFSKLFKSIPPMLHFIPPDSLSLLIVSMSQPNPSCKPIKTAVRFLHDYVAAAIWISFYLPSPFNAEQAWIYQARSWISVSLSASSTSPASNASSRSYLFAKTSKGTLVSFSSSKSYWSSSLHSVMRSSSAESTTKIIPFVRS